MLTRISRVSFLNPVLLKGVTHTSFTETDHWQTHQSPPDPVTTSYLLELDTNKGFLAVTQQSSKSTIGVPLQNVKDWSFYPDWNQTKVPNDKTK